MTTASGAIQSDTAKLLNVDAVADMLSCSTRHVYRLSDSGHACPNQTRLAGPLVVRAIQEWVNQRCPSVRNSKGGSGR